MSKFDGEHDRDRTLEKTDLSTIEHILLQTEFFRQATNNRSIAIPDLVVRRMTTSDKEKIEKITNSQTIDVKELIKHGYIFANFIGNGERPIIALKIESNGEKVDFSKKAFLTRSELEAVKNYVEKKNKNLLSESQNIDYNPEHFAKDLLEVFIHLSTYEKQLNALKSNTNIQQALIHLTKQFKDIGIDFTISNDVLLQQLITNTTSHLYRGIDINDTFGGSHIARGGNRLSGQNPFLESSI